MGLGLRITPNFVSRVLGSNLISSARPVFRLVSRFGQNPARDYSGARNFLRTKIKGARYEISGVRRLEVVTWAVEICFTGVIRG
jgi:hypothetical protein